jgi:homoserine kinase
VSLAKTVAVPASTTNLGSGFDTLGLALKLFLRVEIEESTEGETEIILQGEGAAELPAHSENLILRVMRRVFKGEGVLLPKIRMRVLNQIPVARGLGSSAAAIVAGIGCFEALTGKEMEPDLFFRYAFQFENHPDNLTAARFGGFTVSCLDEGGKITFFRSTLSPGIKILVVVPDFQLETERARSVIPGTVRLQDAVFNIQRSSLTVAALLNSDLHFLGESLKDRVHQPYRAPLIPGFEQILALQREEIRGLRGICLSGAGPSILVLAESNLDQIYSRIEAIFQKHDIRSRAFQLEIDNQGRTIS